MKNANMFVTCEDDTNSIVFLRVQQEGEQSLVHQPP